MKILIVEDEVKMARLIRRALREQEMAADVAKRGEDALSMAGSTDYDVILLDLMLPGIDGFETCRRLRQDGVRAPVLVLTAREAVEDRVAGLDSGADDYMSKPFAVAELLARIRALTRRAPIERAAEVQPAELRLDTASRQARRGEAAIALSATEFALLEALISHPGEVLSRDQLLEQVWGEGDEAQSNVVDVYVYYLRQKVDRPFAAKSIETVRGGGYRLRRAG
jgi:two-component system, OmpR family, response regulator